MGKECIDPGVPGFAVWTFGEGHLGVIMPRRWLEGSAQGFNPGNPQINDFALKLTRNMNVPLMNNTRSSGLEMLKGREADQINLAPIAAQTSEFAIENVLR
jgi:hypothetical protein